MELKVIHDYNYVGLLIVHNESGCQLFSNCRDVFEAHELKGKIEGIYGDDYAMMIDLEVNDQYDGSENCLHNGNIVICGAKFDLVRAPTYGLCP